jgi:hypothetical protein
VVLRPLVQLEPIQTLLLKFAQHAWLDALSAQLEQHAQHVMLETDTVCKDPHALNVLLDVEHAKHLTPLNVSPAKVCYTCQVLLV